MCSSAGQLNQLKHLFSTAPFLIQLDTSKQFIVKVDPFDSGIGSVLSQYEGPSKHLHPCALYFFCCHMSPTEWNYNVGVVTVCDLDKP